MGTIKLDKDEMLKIAGELSVLKDQINNILNKTQETENVLRRETSVSTYSQERKLSDIQDLAFNLVREFDKACDNFYAAARALESSEENILNKISLDRMKMYIDIDKIRNGEKVEGRSLVPKEFSDYKNYLIDEDSAFNFIFSKVLKLITCNKVYSGAEIDDLPKKIAYRKNGFLYVYELKETPMYNFFGTDFYGDFGVYEITKDRKFANSRKLYKFEKVYSTEPELNIGIVSTSDNSIKSKLLPSEGDVGTYKYLRNRGKIGDNITPHHTPSKKYMQQHSVKTNDGVCMNVEHPTPGTGGRHRLTKTYGRNMTDLEKEIYYNLSPRDALAHDIMDLRRIYREKGLYDSYIRSKLFEDISLNKELYPDLFLK